jgi:hypothetical protein
MLRLAHRILSQPIIPVPPVVVPVAHKAYSERYQVDRFLLGATACKHIIADNVADYYADTPRQEWGLTGKNYPCISPPFKGAWFIEWIEPDHLVRANGVVEQISGHTQAGNLLVDLPLEAARTLCRHYGMENEKAEAVFGQARWFLLSQGFASISGHVTYFPYKQGILVAPSGELIDVVFFSDYLDPNGETTPGLNERSCFGLHIPLLTIGFLHCKNVNPIDVTAEEGPSPKWCRRQRLPALRYHVLQIDPNLGRKPRADERRTEGNRSGKPLHICRGHFAHFIDDGVSTGLFGRHQFGTFWISQHLRGSEEHGKIVSTYNVKAPCNSYTATTRSSTASAGLASSWTPT